MRSEVTQFFVKQRADFAGGESLGKAGPYEQISAEANFEIDPKLPANRIIADIDKAAVNESGKVAFQADVVVLRPRDYKRGNGSVLLEVLNRGNAGMLSMFNFGTRLTNPGDRFLMEQGFTLIWVGWQDDVPLEKDRMRLHGAIAKGVRGLVRAEFTPGAGAKSFSVGDRGHLPYKVLADGRLELTVRDRPESNRTKIARADWRLVSGETVEMAKGFAPGKLYELVYESTDPWITGLGPAAIRDVVSFFKYGGPSLLFNDQKNYHKRAIGFGTSQSGRFLRTFLYYGFNADEKGRKVFDGVWAHVAGAGRGSFNHRFAQPSRDGHALMNTLYPTDLYPFADLPEPDAKTEMNEGLLDKARAANVAPKIFYTNGAYEYFGRAASLIHTSPDGKKDIALNSDTRVYFLAGTQHGPGASMQRVNTVNLQNPMDYRWPMRALLLSMQEWLVSGKEPPASAYPQIGKDQLVSLSALHFPAIPGVRKPSWIHQAWRADYGPDFKSKGVVTNEPPVLNGAFAVLVPQVDIDGNEISGIRTPELLTPLGTYAGWNLRDPKLGAPDALYDMIGSFVPFAKTKAERVSKGDPRLSIEERYKGREDYLARVGAAAQKLVAEGTILERDVERIQAQAGRRWDFVMTGK